jgi:HEAT repeat protein
MASFASKLASYSLLWLGLWLSDAFGSLDGALAQSNDPASAHNQSRAPAVRYRFIEDPIAWTVTEKPVSLDAQDLANLRGVSLRAQLDTMQRLVNLAHRGVPIANEFHEPIVSLVNQAKSPDLRRSLAAACLALDLRTTQPTLVSWAMEDPLLFDFVAAGLAKWKADEIMMKWRSQLDGSAGEATLCRALQGLGEFGTEEDLAAIRLVLSTRKEPLVRIAAAKALGSLYREGAEPLARMQWDSASKSSQATSSNDEAGIVLGLIWYHRSDEAKQLLRELVDQSTPSVAAQALIRLLEVGNPPPTDLAKKYLAHSDPALRLACLQVWRQHPDPEIIPLLVERLSDPVAEVRGEAAAQLLELAQASRTSVVEAVTPLLSGTDLMAMEQACLIVGTLQHPGAMKQVGRLLEHPSPDINVTAAWAIRRLSTKESHAEQVMKKAVALATTMIQKAATKFPTEDEYHRLAHLVETAGELRYRGASSDLLRLVPRGLAAVQTRCAAIWALGRIHENDPEWPGRKALEERMMDFEGASPEDPWVRYASAIALGRIGNRASLEKMERINEPSYSSQYPGLEWARQQLRAK